MENAFQSEFACELGCALKDIDQHFKSEFATDLQSSLVIVNDKETGDDLDDEEKLFDDSNYSNLAEDHQSDQVKVIGWCCTNLGLISCVFPYNTHFLSQHRQNKYLKFSLGGKRDIAQN